MKKIMDVISGKVQADSLLEVVPGFIAVVALILLVWKLTKGIDNMVEEGRRVKHE